MIAGRLGPPSRREELARRGSRRDLGLLLAVPVALVVAWMAADPGQAGLAFYPEAPSLTAAFTAHYVHASPGHLARNLAVYGSAVAIGYPLAVLGGCRRRFVSMVVGVLLVVPFVLSGFHLLYWTGGIVGFSGLVMALVGLLPPVLFEYLRSRVDGAIRVTDAPGMFLLGGAAVIWQASGTNLGAERFAAVLAAVGLFALAPVTWRVWRERRRTDHPGRTRGAAAPPIAAVLVLFLAIAVATPGPMDGEVAHVVLRHHLLGYGLGFVGAFGTSHWPRFRVPPAPQPVDD